MKLAERLDAFDKLGDVLLNLSMSDRKALAEKAKNENPWFTEDNVLLALQGANQLLRSDFLGPWVAAYLPEPTVSRRVGVTMAGNIPLVGLHDFICVLISGHNLHLKPSAQDSVLIRFVSEKLIEIEPRFRERIIFSQRLNDCEAVIATGSDNTGRYFEYYFRHIPHILRKNRSSCAVLQGSEPAEELHSLGRDVFSHFGLGCRNVSKLYVPEEFEVNRLLESWKSFERVIDHHKYGHNYDYQKAIAQINSERFLDSGYILLKESAQQDSPVAVLYFERYSTLEDLKQKLEGIKDKLQVIVSARGWYPDSIPFGMAQLPAIDDYADGVDTMRFLARL